MASSAGPGPDPALNPPLTTSLGAASEARSEAGSEAGSDAPPLVRLAGVARTYANGTTALRGFDLAVRAGEFVSLLGPSGCGKTTVLRLVAGLSRPDEGEVEVMGGSPRGATAIGCVFQDPTLMPWASVADNVWLPLRLRGVSRRAAEPAIQAALALVGLRDFAAARPHELSGGMRMRASIARALAPRPRLLLLDEPFAAIDEVDRLRLDDDLLALRRATGATVVFVTHAVAESVYLSDRIAVMGPRPGRVVAEVRVETSRRDAAFRAGPDHAALCARASAALIAAAGRP